MMLDTTRREIPAFVANVHTAAHIDGRTLDRQLRKCSPSQRAVIADDLRTGRLELGPLTARQAQRLARASQGYFNIASKLTDLERLAVCSGSRKLSAFTDKRCEPTPAYFDRLMKRYPTQVMAALDRWTTPSFSF
jgi:hypothetical protein